MINSYKLTRKLYLIGISMLMLAGFLSVFTVSQSSSIISQICTIYNTVRSIIFILGLALIIVGAALYAGGNILPSTQKGSAQGYGMGMIIGGIIGVVIALAAPYILALITGSTISQITFGTNCV